MTLERDEGTRFFIKREVPKDTPAYTRAVLKTDPTNLGQPYASKFFASEGVLPHSSSLKKEGCKDNRFEGEHGAAAALEEERRLAYVAVTRAKEELYISSPGYYRGKQAHVSRFILQPFESRRSRVSNTAQPVPASAAKKTVRHTGSFYA